MVLDVVISTVLYLVARFLMPDAVETVKFLIAVWQPVIIAVIIAITIEDTALIRAGLWKAN